MAENQSGEVPRRLRDALTEAALAQASERDALGDALPEAAADTHRLLDILGRGHARTQQLDSNSNPTDQGFGADYQLREVRVRIREQGRRRAQWVEGARLLFRSTDVVELLLQVVGTESPDPPRIPERSW